MKNKKKTPKVEKSTTMELDGVVCIDSSRVENKLEGNI